MNSFRDVLFLLQQVCVYVLEAAVDIGHGRYYYAALENAAVACYTQYEGGGPRQDVGAQGV